MPTRGENAVDARGRAEGASEPAAFCPTWLPPGAGADLHDMGYHIGSLMVTGEGPRNFAAGSGLAVTIG